LRAHQDENYKQLKTTIIKDGWPDKRINLHPELESFWIHRESLSIEYDGFIVKKGLLLVSAGLHQTHLQWLLAMHQQSKKDGSLSKRINLVAIHHKRHQEHCKNVSTMLREAAEPSTGARRHLRGSFLSIPLSAHGSCEL
jgi:hypothetical protein